MRITGVEPAWAQCSHGPEPCASAYSAISAYSFLPSEFLHGREGRTEVELIAWSTFCKTSRNFASSPTWCNLIWRVLIIGVFCNFTQLNKRINNTIAWICLNQLKRLNLTEEMRHYLIGRQYDSERAAYWYSVEHTENAEPMSRTTLRRLISGRIAQKNNVSQGTVEKYSRYSRAIDRRTYFSFCLFSTHILKSSVSVCVSFFSAFCSDKRAVPFGFFSYDTRITFLCLSKTFDPLRKFNYPETIQNSKHL